MPEHTELKTKLGRTWKIKTLIFAVALLALGLWGAYDALSKYPKRGRIHSEFALQDYLEQADAEFRLASASVEDPAGEFARLSESSGLMPLEVKREQWLRSLSRIGNLNAISRQNREAMANRAQGDPYPDTPTMFSDPEAELRSLGQLNQNRNRPSALNAYDMPLQFAFMIGGFAGFLYMVLFYVRVGRKSFRYDPDSKKLTLANGRALTPEDIEVVDKRKWDKFLVFLTPKDGSQEIRLDLYRYEPLERWILELEKLTPGYQPVVEEGEPVLCVNVLDGSPVRVVPDSDTSLPARDDAGRESLYPAMETVAGEWLVVGASQRTRLREAAEKGDLDRGALKVDTSTFRITIADHDPESIPERDLAETGGDNGSGSAPSPPDA